MDKKGLAQGCSVLFVILVIGFLVGAFVGKYWL